MVIYKNNSTDAYFNLALEQYLLDSREDNIFMLWRNDKAVIIGKNQNAYAELDVDYVEKNNIKVVRRLTGGGAVFHDIGNINFSFIVPETERAVLDFARFTKPIIEALKSLGIENVCLSGRNDIMIGGRKVSGNAQSSYNGKTLHHGCLLYSADLSMLTGALRVDPEKIKSKGIKSVRNRVGNIKDFLKTDMSVNDFMNYLENYVASETDSKVINLTEEDIKKTQKLADEKYSTWDWNFGKSKEFSVQKKKRYDFGSVAVDLTVEGGIIRGIKITGDFFGVRDVGEIENILTNTKFETEALKSRINDSFINECISGMNACDFVSLLMS